MKMQAFCSGTECVSWKECKKVDHTILAIEYPCGTAPNWLLKCDLCGSQHHMVVPKISKKKRVWPYYNESAGVTFESESHETKYAKDNNLIAL